MAGSSHSTDYQVSRSNFVVATIQEALADSHGQLAFAPLPPPSTRKLPIASQSASGWLSATPRGNTGAHHGSRPGTVPVPQASETIIDWATSLEQKRPWRAAWPSWNPRPQSSDGRGYESLEMLLSHGLEAPMDPFSSITSGSFFPSAGSQPARSARQRGSQASFESGSQSARAGQIVFPKSWTAATSACQGQLPLLGENETVGVNAISVVRPVSPARPGVFVGRSTDMSVKLPKTQRVDPDFSLRQLEQKGHAGNWVLHKQHFSGRGGKTEKRRPGHHREAADAILKVSASEALNPETGRPIVDTTWQHAGAGQSTDSQDTGMEELAETRRQHTEWKRKVTECARMLEMEISRFRGGEDNR